MEWQSPDPSVLRYELSLVGGDLIPLEAGETSYTFTGLEPDTEYNIEIVAENLGGRSDPTTTRMHTGMFSKVAWIFYIQTKASVYVQVCGIRDEDI